MNYEREQESLYTPLTASPLKKGEWRGRAEDSNHCKLSKMTVCNQSEMNRRPDHCTSVMFTHWS